MVYFVGYSAYTLGFFSMFSVFINYYITLE